MVESEGLEEVEPNVWTERCLIWKYLQNYRLHFNTRCKWALVLCSVLVSVCWKLVWSSGFYQLRISVPLFAMCRSHSKRSAKRQMSPKKPCKHAGNEICYHLTTVASLAYEFKKRRSVYVCILPFCSLTCLSAHIQQTNVVFLSKCFDDVNPRARPCVCPFVKQRHCIKQADQRCLCGRCIWIDSFFLQKLISYFMLRGKAVNPICLQSQQHASKAT